MTSVRQQTPETYLSRLRIRRSRVRVLQSALLHYCDLRGIAEPRKTQSYCRGFLTVICQSESLPHDPCDLAAALLVPGTVTLVDQCQLHFRRVVLPLGTESQPGKFRIRRTSPQRGCRQTVVKQARSPERRSYYSSRFSCKRRSMKRVTDGARTRDLRSHNPNAD